MTFLTGGGTGGGSGFMDMNAIRGNEMFGGGGGGFDFGKMFGGANDFLGSQSFNNLGKLGSLALQGYGLNKSLGIQEDQLGILKEQENRAATAQNLGTTNSQSLALQMTTPGTAEHEQVKKAIAEGTYQV